MTDQSATTAGLLIYLAAGWVNLDHVHHELIRELREKVSIKGTWIESCLSSHQSGF